MPPDTTATNRRPSPAVQHGPVLVGRQGAALRAAPAGAGLDADSAQDGIAIAAGIERDDVRPIAGWAASEIAISRDHRTTGTAIAAHAIHEFRPDSRTRRMARRLPWPFPCPHCRPRTSRVMRHSACSIASSSSTSRRSVRRWRRFEMGKAGPGLSSRSSGNFSDAGVSRPGSRGSTATPADWIAWCRFRARVVDSARRAAAVAWPNAPRT